MHRVHIVEWKRHGKTALIVDLVQEYCRRGIRFGTIKHSRHVHELDTPDKDSDRHRAAGSQGAANSVVDPEVPWLASCQVRGCAG